ncbi:hypothetical protein [Paenibacillus sp. GP183]|uniref:hypothetical protein n=1 Tax=Paenibacillus sp. GP183 TaxID=1882751 RepID=UPI00089B2E1E|nr:hypothetical protein [Paenibacillus sp. GP183]SED14534.1 hypothetical protein SAMN05443246_5893 [Paenibacillus sp. GP183]
MTTEKDDWTLQTRSSVNRIGIGRGWNRLQTAFGQVRDDLVFKRGSKERDRKNTITKSNINKEINPKEEWTKLIQAKNELDFMIHELYKIERLLSPEGKRCVQQLMKLFNETHSLVANAAYQERYHPFFEGANNKPSVINKNALITGLKTELMMLFNNRRHQLRASIALDQDIQQLTNWGEKSGSSDNI